MGRYFINRLFQTIIVIFGVSLLSFGSLHLAGDPTYLYVSERASDEAVEETRHKLGFDRPVGEQYFTFLTGMMRGDFGNSLKARRPAFQVVKERLPATIELTFFAMLVASLLAIPIGILAALKRGTFLDGGIMMFAIIGQSIPNFWLGIMLVLYVGLRFKEIPISGHVPLLDPLLDGDFGLAYRNFPEAIKHLLLPGFTVGLFSLSRNARLIRATMLEVLSKEYVTTARAKGLRSYTVVMRHAFRNALIPFVTILGLEFGFLLSGVVVVETIFSWPGVGRLVFLSIEQRDIPVVQTAVVMFSILFVGLNFIVDLIYVRLDPRIRLN